MAKIAVVDDEQDIVDVLEYNLKAAGFEVVSAIRGKEGLDMVATEQPDLLILDLMLPDISGTEVCRTLRATPFGKRLPIVMLSARGEEIDRVVGFDAQRPALALDATRERTRGRDGAQPGAEPGLELVVREAAGRGLGAHEALAGFS